MEQVDSLDKQNDQINDTAIRPKGNRFLNVFIFIFFMIFIQLPAILALSTLGLAVSNKSLGLIIGLAIGFIILSAFVIWAVRTYYRRHTYENIHQPLKLKDIGINILWFIGLRIMIIIMSAIMVSIYGQHQSNNDKALMKNLERIDTLTPSIIIALIVFFVAITFIAPYVEEHAFRGIFKETIFNKGSFILPLILSSVIFSANHSAGNLIAFLMYMLMGIGLYLAYKRRGSLKDSILVHMLNNAYASVVLIGALISIIMK
ncbi:CPBP family intramembrane metalloprotease [Staphylococcus sp. NRL 16/872]|uniref:CPBP family intramembrane glutamic endopeptidase n=1 Tax=Staphylococcus sp. NRL 16/872 TaxID=2930131 RepID=UPI001FB29F46|nr:MULTISPECIES: CPBP family intramembrane glutamic endopeptidase [unclassified Staphylococcus]MCJ1655341.1 CPBP family intramembrane metalloprotease [Staphylococcus sp. NRL 21/187]MCJ1661178.1 CPBP family intramembrane metalloprotease [Staphylococcus sp. NRL 18/288]MCJ1667069.1 CPBP family intramembrane metalloprotease [Staphylococcus sp. NRL 19/737]WEN69544.1 CPBP family intramembrane metalloprotease [Staphylococcus sp. NRL 16/872]